MNGDGDPIDAVGPPRRPGLQVQPRVRRRAGDARRGPALQLTGSLALALLLAACVAANPSPNGVASLPSPSLHAAGASTAPSANASLFDRLLTYAQCMRSHGIADYPDPQQQPDGLPGFSIQAGPGSDLNGQSPTFQAAQRACQSLMPTPAPAQLQQFDQAQAQARAQALKFSQCMRSHGVPHFPDPTFTNGGIKIAIRANNGIDPNAPTFRAAQQACQSLMPGANRGSPQSSQGGAGAGPGVSGGGQP